MTALKASRLPYGFMVSKMSSARSNGNSISRAKWWEMLAVFKRLAVADQQYVCSRIKEITGFFEVIFNI